MTHSIKIKSIHSQEVLDSRGFPTVEVQIISENPLTPNLDIHASALVPSGASTGEGEALELRDGDMKRYLGKGVLKAIDNIQKKIAPALIHQSFARQTALDDLLREIDGTQNKSNLGANAILAVSLAFARTYAAASQFELYQSLGKLYQSQNCTLPVPLMNVINGGQHADNDLAVQEFMIVPAGFSTFSEALRAGVETFHHLKKILHSNGLSTAVGDEGGFAPHIQGEHPHEQALEFLVKAITEAGYKPGGNIFIALDAAASEFLDKSSKSECIYNFEEEKRSSSDMIDLYQRWCKQYPIISIEDGLSEHDWSGWQEMTKKIGSNCQIVGDDLFVTNASLLKKGIETKAANSILIKVNQIGSLTETLETMRLAGQASFSNIVSHRSGETEDTFIADLAVATDCGQIKTGSASRTDRIAKYNRLLRIESQLGSKATFLGKKAFKSI